MASLVYVIIKARWIYDLRLFWQSKKSYSSWALISIVAPISVIIVMIVMRCHLLYLRKQHNYPKKNKWFCKSWRPLLYESIFWSQKLACVLPVKKHQKIWSHFDKWLIYINFHINNDFYTIADKSLYYHLYLKNSWMSLGI